MIKAIIFDFDGTIIDTETAWYEAFRDAYSKHDVDLSLEMYSGCIGTSLHTFNPYEYLITHMKLPINLDSFRNSVRSHHSALMEQEQIRPGIMEYLKDAKAHGLRIGLASSSSRDWIDKYLDQLGIRKYFDCIRTADDVKKVKPDPELYLQTLDCLRVSAQEAIAIEDSPNGARAAAAAGLYSVVIPNAITTHLEFETSNYRLESLVDLDFRHLIANPQG
jgi:HAD superfamily hydrolase (TIGR01509 family)